MNQSNPTQALLGTDPENQTIVVVFNTTIQRLVLTPEQAELLGNELIERTKTLKLQQRN